MFRRATTTTSRGRSRMGTVFVDTSGIYAFLVPEDTNHRASLRVAKELEAEGVSLVSTSYVVHETVALLQARSGVDAVRRFHEAVVPGMEVVWIDAETHGRGMSALLAARNRKVSLTDWTSFEVMRDRGIDRAFAFDPHFRRRGFRLLP